MGDLEQALKHHEQSVALRELIGNAPGIADSLSEMGIIYLTRGELDQARDMLEQSLQMRKKLGNKHSIAETLLQLALVERERGNHVTAIQYFIESSRIFRHIPNLLQLSEALFHLIITLVENQDLETAYHYFNELQLCAEEQENPFTRQRHEACRGLLLMQQSRMHDKIKALQIFERIAKEEIVSHELTSFALMQYCELLLMEYQVTYSPDTFAEFNRLLDDIEKKAQNARLHPLIVQIKRLRAKMHLILMDLETTLELLEQAKTECETRDLMLLKGKVEEDLTRILSELKRWSQALWDSPEELKRSLTLTVKDLLNSSKKTPKSITSKEKSIKSLTDTEVKEFLSELRRNMKKEDQSQ